MAASTIQAMDIVFSDVTATTLTAGWTRGDGEFVVVFATATPGGELRDGINNGETYTANGSFGSGTQPFGHPDWFCVYNGVGVSDAFTELSPGVAYTFQAFEYNGTGGAVEYLVDTAKDNPASVTTVQPRLIGGWDDDDE